jgi:hypothetical protein
MGRFYGHFAAAYGTMCLVMVLLAVVTQSHIETGLFGLIGFPIIALIYAAVRVTNPAATTSRAVPAGPISRVRNFKTTNGDRDLTLTLTIEPNELGYQLYVVSHDGSITEDTHHVTRDAARRYAERTYGVPESLWVTGGETNVGSGANRITLEESLAPFWVACRQTSARLQPINVLRAGTSRDRAACSAWS